MYGDTCVCIYVIYTYLFIFTYIPLTSFSRCLKARHLRLVVDVNDLPHSKVESFRF
jgi:hypothetical protein